MRVVMRNTGERIVTSTNTVVTVLAVREKAVLLGSSLPARHNRGRRTWRRQHAKRPLRASRSAASFRARASARLSPGAIHE